MLNKEYRYLIIVQYELDGKQCSSSNKIPITDLKTAFKIATKNLPVNIKNIIITGLKYTYADVPITNIIKGTKYEMQCIHCKSLSTEEINNLGSNNARN